MSSIKYRHLGRDSAHRQALLRNLVTSLIERESISTTWTKAKEAQRLAEKLITLGKKNTNAARQKAQAIFYVCLCPPFLESPGTLTGARFFDSLKSGDL
jgi:ribosomal protein L17